MIKNKRRVYNFILSPMAETGEPLEVHAILIKLRRRDKRYKRYKRRTERYHQYKVDLSYAIYYENKEP